MTICSVHRSKKYSSMTTLYASRADVNFFLHTVTWKIQCVFMLCLFIIFNWINAFHGSMRICMFYTNVYIADSTQSSLVFLFIVMRNEFVYSFRVMLWMHKFVMVTAMNLLWKFYVSWFWVSRFKRRKTSGIVIRKFSSTLS